MAVANHQNSFMDPALGAAVIPQQLTFFGRADVFVKPWAKLLLNQLKLYPIFRIRDKVNTVSMNEPVFDFAANTLNAGNPILLFPEANNDKRYRLRTLHKGFARMAFLAADKNGWQKDILILPLGLQFDSHENFQSRVLLSFGKPISLFDYKTLYLNNPSEALNKIRTDVSQAMKPLMLHIDDLKDYHHYAEAVKMMVVHSKKLSLADRKEKSQDIVNEMECIKNENPEVFERLCELVQTYTDRKRDFKFRDHIPERAPYSRMTLFLQSLFYFLFAPFALVGIAIHYPLYKWIDKVVNRMVKDDQFLAGIKFVAGMMLFQVQYVIMVLIISIFIKWWISIAIILVLPFLGLSSFRWWVLGKKWKSRLKFQKLNQSGDAGLQEMLHAKEEVRKLLFQVAK